MKHIDQRDRLLFLVKYFSFENLLKEIVVGMSSDEAKEMADHIIRMYNLDDDVLFDIETKE